MSWTTADLDKIKAAIATGVLKVRYADGKAVDYASIPDMLKAKAAIETELAAAAVGGSSRVVRHSLVSFREPQ